MGRKRSRTGQLIYLCIALLILISVWGCAFLQGMREGEDARRALLRGRQLLAQQDYEGSLRENQKALGLSANRPPADEAIFNLGLIFAHVGNPKKDNRTAVGYFTKLVKEYPQSPWVEQARVWVGVLQLNEKLAQILEKSKQVDIEIEEKKRQKERQER